MDNRIADKKHVPCLAVHAHIQSCSVLAGKVNMVIFTVIVTAIKKVSHLFVETYSIYFCTICSIPN